MKWEEAKSAPDETGECVHALGQSAHLQARRPSSFSGSERGKSPEMHEWSSTGDERAGREAVTAAAQDVIRDGAAAQGRASELASGGVLYTRRGVRCHGEAETSK